MNNIIRGFEYEKQIKNYIITNLNKKCYLWSETPETILLYNNIIGSHNDGRIRRKNTKENRLIDTGIDIIQIENDDGLCSIVQCKNCYNKGITIHNLSGFLSWMFSLPTINGYVYYTKNLSINLRSLPKNDRINYIKIPFIENNIIETKMNITSFDYQIEAKNKIINYFKENNRGILSAPCGIGKTHISYLVSTEFNKVIILSPLIQFSKQNLDKFIEYGYNNKNLLVNCENERDITKIKEFIKLNEKYLISCTYDSIDIIIPLL